MSSITTKFGSGGRNMVPGGAQGTPTLADTFRDVADDLAGVKATAITSPDATDLASVITLANEIKAALNALAAYSIKTVKG